MATYGNFPGVKISTSGGGVSGVSVGEEEKLVLFAPGDPANGTASVNDPTQVSGLADADKKFGDGSRLANAMKLALANGANRDYLYGVMLAQKSVTGEDITAGGTAADHTGGSKITNMPLVEDTSLITFVDDATTPVEHTVTFKYETNTDNTTTDFTSMSPGADEVYINPLTGEWVADDSDNYSIDYDYYDYAAGFNAADGVLDEAETGIYAAVTEAPDVHSTLTSKLGTLRGNYQMAQAVAPARPNETLSNGQPGYDDNNYSDNSADDSFYLIAPGRQKNSRETIIPAVSGLMAGHAIDNPVYNDVLTGMGDLAEKFVKTAADNLRSADVIPVQQAGNIRVKANRSTAYSSQTDWTRDFWRRRIVDRVILITKQVGDDTIGRINDAQTRRNARDAIVGEFRQMVRNRILKPNEGGETRWVVEVVEDANNQDQVNINVGVTPMGVVKRIDETITISA